MVLVLLLVKALVPLICNFKQVGRACRVGMQDRGLLQGNRYSCCFCPFIQARLGNAKKGKDTLCSFVTDIVTRTAGKALSLVIVDQKPSRFAFALKTL